MAKRYHFDQDIVTLQVPYITDTDLAILVEDAKERECWIPKSQLVEFIDNKDGTCTIAVAEELAVDKELV